MKYMGIVLFSVGAAVAYGLLQDQVTAHLCVDYFTIGHMIVLGITDPTLVGVEWGIIATWWVGLGFGVLAGCLARLGPWPRLSACNVVIPTLVLMGCVGVAAVVAGVIGHVAALHGWVSLPEPLATSVPAAQHVAFLTDLWAHGMAYAAGFGGFFVLCIWIWRTRRALAQAHRVGRRAPAEESGPRRTGGSGNDGDHGQSRLLTLLRVLQVMGGASLLVGVLYNVSFILSFVFV